MIRNLKVLLVAAMALTALGAFGASGAKAAEFHCSVEPCTYTAREDGTGKTAHQVFIVENTTTTESVSFTCKKLTGHGTSAAKTATTLTVLVAYSECEVNGSPGVSVNMNGCDYAFTSHGTVSVVGCEGKKIEVSIPTGCTFTIGETGALNGVSYHNLGETPNREVTVAASDVHGITVTADGTDAQCLIKTNQHLEGTYITGNAIVTAENHNGSGMADGWWA